VTFAAATDEARPILTGVLAKFEGDKLTLAAADNYRIAVKTLTVLDPSRRRASSFRPDRSRAVARSVDTDDPVDIVLSPSRNQILFHIEGIDLVSRLIDGQFPNYQQVLPKGFTTKATSTAISCSRPSGWPA
jgi:DNA polymerase-3 subunit beta